jgi:type VI secretion system protein
MTRPSPLDSIAHRRGLLGRLAGRGPAGDAHAAVCAHLQALLNTRLGESLCAPGLGLVDFADVVHGFPASAQVLVTGIRAMLLAYEPRLCAVQVRLVPSADALALAFEISAKFADGRAQLRLRTELSSSGRFDVRQL